MVIKLTLVTAAKLVVVVPAAKISAMVGMQPPYGARHFQSLTSYDLTHDDGVDE